MRWWKWMYSQIGGLPPGAAPGYRGFVVMPSGIHFVFLVLRVNRCLLNHVFKSSGSICFNAFV